MYNRNPILIAGGNRNRQRTRARVGAEFVQCPDGTWVTGSRANCPQVVTTPPPGGYTGGGSPTPSAPWNPGGNGTPGGPFIPNWSPPSGQPWTPGPALPGPVPTPVPTPIPTPGNCAPICNVCPENMKRYPLPFVPAAGYTESVAAGALVVFTGKPQKMFAPDRLIISSSIAPYFNVVSLVIANIPQSLAQGEVSAEMFSEVATYVMMTFDQAYPGIDVTITARNKSSVTQIFQAQLVGEAIG